MITKTTKFDRRLYAVLRVLESQVIHLASDRRDDAGAAALRVMDRDNQEAAADRELAIRLSGQADGLWEALELIQECMPKHVTYTTQEARTAS